MNRSKTFLNHNKFSFFFPCGCLSYPCSYMAGGWHSQSPLSRQVSAALSTMLGFPREGWACSEGNRWWHSKKCKERDQSEHTLCLYWFNQPPQTLHLVLRVHFISPQRQKQQRRQQSGVCRLPQGAQRPTRIKQSSRSGD